MIDETWVLMRETVVGLLPNVRGKQIVQRRDLFPPRNTRRYFSHLAC